MDREQGFFVLAADAGLALSQRRRSTLSRPGIDKARSVALLLAFVAAGLSGEFFHRGADALNSEECSWQIRK
ncbi:hypothetical protein JKG47_17235 [Acidithiobacillus sp. MC6.1]|nr:hypothetical protein [Acidithiobacillus sp. MC6.1]